MQSGRTVSELAVYLPNEDMWMLGSMPRELRTPGAAYWWEMRHVVVPEEARPFQPLWVSTTMLARAELREGRLAIGSQSFAALYLDVEWLDADALAEMHRLASAGLKVILKRRPRQPGYRPRGDYEIALDSLAAMPNVVASLAQAGLRPVVSGENLPSYWGAKWASTPTFSSPTPRPPRSAIRCRTDFPNATRRSAAGSLYGPPRRRPTSSSSSALPVSGRAPVRKRRDHSDRLRISTAYPRSALTGPDRRGQSLLRIRANVPAWGRMSFRRSHGAQPRPDGLAISSVTANTTTQPPSSASTQSCRTMLSDSSARADNERWPADQPM